MRQSVKRVTDIELFSPIKTMGDFCTNEMEPTSTGSTTVSEDSEFMTRTRAHESSLGVYKRGSAG